VAKKIKTIGIIAPASALKAGEDEKLAAGIHYLEGLGLKVKKAKNLEEQSQLTNSSETWLAGNIEQRISGMMELWEDKSVDALLALRGGYGSNQLLGKLDYKWLRQHPKVVLGYSDITALHWALYTQAYRRKLPVFHTPMLTELSSLDSEERGSFERVLEIIDPEAYVNYRTDKLKRPGIFGGNLSVLAGLLGSKYLPSFRNKILFLEDCKEPVYKTERLIYQLAYAGIFDHIKELWLGASLETDFNYELINNIAKKKGFKVSQDLPYGHAIKQSLIMG